MSDVVQTATGAVEAGDLGLVLTHEHLMFGAAGYLSDPSTVVDPDDALTAATERLAAVANLGVGTIVDPTPPDMGRDVDMMTRASEATGVRVVFATGLYALWPTPSFALYTIDELTEFFLHELTEGVTPSGPRAGIIKLSIGKHPLTRYAEKALTAAAAAQRGSGAPIMVHLEPGLAAPVLAELTQRGVPAAAVLLAHAESTPDLRLLGELAGTGAWLGIDRFGFETPNRFGHGISDQQRFATVLGLRHLGALDRLLISTDSTCVLQGHLGRETGRIQDLNPRWRPEHLLKDVVPRLRDLGLADSEVDRLLRDNPAVWLRGTAVATDKEGASA